MRTNTLLSECNRYKFSIFSIFRSPRASPVDVKIDRIINVFFFAFSQFCYVYMRSLIVVHTIFLSFYVFFLVFRLPWNREGKKINKYLRDTFIFNLSLLVHENNRTAFVHAKSDLTLNTNGTNGPGEREIPHECRLGWNERPHERCSLSSGEADGGGGGRGKRARECQSRRGTTRVNREKINRNNLLLLLCSRSGH